MLALVALFLGANAQLLTGDAVERLDGEQFFAPFFSYLADVVRSGHWLLWNPFSNAGSPDFAEPQIGALSPLTLGFAALAGPSALAFRLYWLSIWLLGGIGMFVYTRSLGAPVWGRFVAGLSFVFCGFYIGHGQHISVVYSTSFLPWIILRLDRALLTHRRAPAAEAGALFGLSALAGNPAITITTGIFATGFVVVRWVSNSANSPTARVRPALEALTLFGIVAVIVLSPSYFSFKYESLGYSDRAGVLSRECVVSSNGIEPIGLLAILSPYAPTMSSANGTQPAISPTYFGVVPLALALLALAQPDRRRLKMGLLFLGLLFLGFTLGTTLPLRGWLYDLVPPTRYFRHPNMFRIYFIFSIIVLATLATGRIERWRRFGDVPASGLRLFKIASVIVAVICAAGFAALRTHFAHPGPSMQTALGHILFVSVAMITLAVFVRAEPARLAKLPAALLLLTAVDLLGAHFLSADFAYSIGTGEQPRPASVRSPVELGANNFARAFVVSGNPQLYLHKPVYCSYAALLNSLHMQSAETKTLMNFATGEKRVWFAKDVVEAPATGDVLALLTQEASERNAPVLLRHRRGVMLQEDAAPALNAAAIHDAPAAMRVPFEVLDYRPNELSLKISCPSDGWVLITDRWSRSWRATVNGAYTPISGGNLFFRLVPVQAGESIIAMKFEPFLLWPLLAGSWMSLVGVGIAAATRSWQRSVSRRRYAAPKCSIPPVPCAVCS